MKRASRDAISHIRKRGPFHTSLTSFRNTHGFCHCALALLCFLFQEIGFRNVSITIALRYAKTSSILIIGLDLNRAS